MSIPQTQDMKTRINQIPLDSGTCRGIGGMSCGWGKSRGFLVRAVEKWNLMSTWKFQQGLVK
jgi:hypothetical protein